MMPIIIIINRFVRRAMSDRGKRIWGRGVSLHTDELLQDPLTFKRTSSYELFCFFHYICSFFFSLLVVHPNLLTNTLYSPMTRYSLVVLKVSLNINQSNKQCVYTHSQTIMLLVSVIDVYFHGSTLLWTRPVCGARRLSGPGLYHNMLSLCYFIHKNR